MKEIPQALELIGKGAEQKIAAISHARFFSMKRVVLPALLRMVVGYLFLFCLFLTVVQESTVLDVFFDVLALEFVESIDDIIFGLSKRGESIKVYHFPLSYFIPSQHTISSIHHQPYSFSCRILWSKTEGCHQ